MIRFFKKSFYTLHITHYALLFIIALSLFTYLHFSFSLPDPDAFYHAKMAVLMKDQGVVKSFPWLQFTVLKNYYTDHHFLYHLLLVPFVKWLDPLIGLKVAAVFFSSFIIVIFYWLLKKLSIKFAFWYSLLLLVINPFIFRLALGKAQPLSLIFLLLSLYVLLKKQYWLLAVLSFFYVWTHGSWPIILSIVLIYVFCDFVLKGGHFRRANLKLLLSTFSGIIAGLIFNPYFPVNFKFYFYQIVKISLINFQETIGVGGEWYPYSPGDLIANISLAFIVFVLGLLLFSIFVKKQSAFSWTLLLSTVIFFVFTLKSRRYVEYLVPLMMLSAAFSINLALKRTAAWLWAKPRARDYWLWFKNKVYNKSKKRLLIRAVVVYFLLALVFIIGRDLITARDDFRDGFRFDKFKEASIWLKDNTLEKSIVFHSDWDDFPILFYHNSHNYYIVGLDPTFMYEYDKDLYQKWVNITVGEQKEDLYSLIKNDFQAAYVFIGKDHLAMNSNIREVENFKLVYADEEAWVYKVE